MTALRPGSPTTSPRKRTVSIEQDRIEEVPKVDVSFPKESMDNDKTRMTKSELMTNDEIGRMALRHSGFGILSLFVIWTLSFVSVVLLPALQAADNLGVLGSKPKWVVLENYQRTITRDEFAH